MDTIYKGDLSTKARPAQRLAGRLVHRPCRAAHSVDQFRPREGRAALPLQPSHPRQSASFTRKVGLKSLINLRGQAKNGSDALSRDTAARLGLDFYDMAMESRGAPHKDRILRLAEIFTTMRGPALIHCKSGADSAGLAAGLFILLKGGTVADALKQLSLRFGHIKQAKTGILDAFFLTYQREGEAMGKNFLDWVREDYSEDALRASFKSNALAGFVTDKIFVRE